MWDVLKYSLSLPCGIATFKKQVFINLNYGGIIMNINTGIKQAAIIAIGIVALGLSIKSGLEGLAGKDRKVVVKGLAEKEVLVFCFLHIKKPKSSMCQGNECIIFVRKAISIRAIAIKISSQSELSNS